MEGKNHRIYKNVLNITLKYNKTIFAEICSRIFLLSVLAIVVGYLVMILTVDGEAQVKRYTHQFIMQKAH